MSGSTRAQTSKGSGIGCLLGIVLSIVGTIIGVFVTFLILVTFFSGLSASDGSIVDETVLKGSSEEKIAIIPMKGLIMSNGLSSYVDSTITPGYSETMLKKALNDKSVKAIIIDMDTPGGEVLASDLIYESIKKANDDKPVFVWIGNSGTSGGYYIAMAATEVHAHPKSITGSIGVILELRSISGLYEKLGIRTKIFKSANFKDNEALWSKDSGELESIYQSIIDEMYDSFIDIVSESREMDKEVVRKLADGRLYSGQQALENDLIDSVGSIQATIDTAKDTKGLDNPTIVRYRQPENLLSFPLLGFFREFTRSQTSLESFFKNPGTELYYLSSPLGEITK